MNNYACLRIRFPCLRIRFAYAFGGGNADRRWWDSNTMKFDQIEYDAVGWGFLPLTIKFDRISFYTAGAMAKRSVRCSRPTGLIVCM